MSVYQSKLLQIFRDTCELITVGVFFFGFEDGDMTSCTCYLNCGENVCCENLFRRGMTFSACRALQFFFIPPELEFRDIYKNGKKCLQSILHLEKSGGRGKHRKISFKELEAYRTFQSSMLTHFLHIQAILLYISHTNHRLLCSLACL